ncbi:MAG: glycoside hydrolase family 127 protein [Aristaeellaceae bacterium]
MSASIRMQSFGLSQIELTDAYACNALQRDVDYLMSLQPERLLAGFYENAGLPGAQRYGGWEKHLLAGHTLGHYLTAAAQGYANAGTRPADRQALYAHLTACVDGLKLCQQHSKGKPGFIFGGVVIDPEQVEIQFDNVEKRKTNIYTEAWVPWYNVHKVLSGLLCAYECTGYAPALEVAQGLGEWTYDRASAWSEETRLTVLATEYGGMNDCLYDLYAITGNAHFAIAAHCFDEDALFERVLTGAPNVLNNRHANTTIPKFLGSMNRYRTMQGEVDATRYLAYAQAFWTMVTQRHTYATGGNSEWEHFGMDNVLDAERTSCNNETCNVYNMMKLSKWLYEATGESQYLDYYENALYNTILSSQNPHTGMTTYFQPMASGYFKVFGTPYESFWCCTGSGMENFTKLNAAVYAHTEDAVLVNLYLSSTLHWADKGLTLRQDSRVTDEGCVDITVEAAQQPFELRLRVPAWAGSLTATVDGRTVEASARDGYITLPGVAAGSCIHVELPLSLRAEPLPDNPTVMAFRYGPLVLSAGLGAEKMKTAYTGVEVLIPAQAMGKEALLTLPEGVTREDFTAHLTHYLRKEEGALRFALTGTDFVFTPHYLRFNERYAIYLRVLTPSELVAYEEEKRRSQGRILDSVQPGYGQYENDALHSMQEHDTQASTDDGSCRRACAGGSFTYRMAVDPAGGNELRFLLRQEDNKQTLRITTGDTELLSRTLHYVAADAEYQVIVPIPDALAALAEPFEQGGTTYHLLPFTFSGVDGQPSARVCEYIRTVCRT